MKKKEFMGMAVEIQPQTSDEFIPTKTIYVSIIASKSSSAKKKFLHWLRNPLNKSKSFEFLGLVDPVSNRNIISDSEQKWAAEKVSA